VNKNVLAVSVALLSVGAVWFVGACGTPADQFKIGGECTANGTDAGTCENQDLTCLTEFAGGYCGAKGCLADADCPQGSICVTSNSVNYCFRVCLDKPECNLNRTVTNESNCSSNIERVDGGNTKACIPPSGS
jgi:hypothetical protein